MPTVTDDEVIVVPIVQNTRADVYYRMNVEQRILAEPQRAASIAREFYNAVRPVEFPAGVSLADVRAHTVFGTVPLTYVPMSVAEGFTLRDTLGRAHLEAGTGNRVTLVPNGQLDKRAWANFDRAIRNLDTFEFAGDTERSVAVAHLENVLNSYRAYAQDHRMRLIRDIVGVQMSTVTVRENKKEVRSGKGDFTKFFRQFQAQLNVESNPFQLLPILPHGTLSSRRWGIEVEAVDIGGIKTPKYWVLKGDGSLRSMSNRAMPAHLDDCATHRDPDCGHSREEGCTNDCSCGYEQSTTGQTATGEWNSPVLRSFHSRGLEHICKQLEDRQTNYSAGVHVHVEAGDLTPEQASQVSLMYTAWEPLFEAEYKRETRDYCNSISGDTVIRTIKQMRDHQRKNGSKAIRNAPGGERYQTVNLCALSSHGTIEFRAMGNVYDYDKLVRWASFLRELLNMAKRGVPQKEWGKVKTFKDVIVIMSKYGKETPTPEWAPATIVASPVEQLGREIRRNPNQINHPDGVADVFEDYSAREPVLTDVSR